MPIATQHIWSPPKLGWVPKNGKPIHLNGALFNLCELLKFVAGSAAEAELGALFLCGQKVKIF